jgi:hypothetical protein
MLATVSRIAASTAGLDDQAAERQLDLGQRALRRAVMDLTRSGDSADGTALLHENLSQLAADSENQAVVERLLAALQGGAVASTNGTAGQS